MAGTDGHSDERTDKMGADSGSSSPAGAHGVAVDQAQVGKVSGYGGGAGRAGAIYYPEVTPEMADAGARVLYEHISDAVMLSNGVGRELAIEVYRAMYTDYVK